MTTSRARAAALAMLAGLTLVTGPARAFNLEKPNIAQAVGLYISPPQEQPPFLHWDMREFPTCTIPYSYGTGTADIALDGEFTAADAGFALWNAVTPSIASWSRVPAPAGAKPPGFLDGNNIVGWVSGLAPGQTGDDTWLVPAASQACGASVGAGTPIIGPGADGWVTTLTNSCTDDRCLVTVGTAALCACGAPAPEPHAVLIAPGANGVLETTVNNCGNAGADDVVIGGVIYDGPNGIIDTRIAPDDAYVGATITAGPDGIVNSVPGGNITRAIALAELFYDLPSGVMLETDIALNDDYTWQSVPDDGTMGGHPDVQMIVAHEVGHLLGLHHANEFSSNSPDVAPNYLPLMSQFTYLNDDAWAVAPAFQACGSPLPSPRAVIIQPGPDGVLATTANNCGGGDDFWDRITNRIRDGGDQTVDTFIAPDRAMHFLHSDDRNGANFLYTPDLGDAPDPLVAGGTLNRYPTVTRTAGGGRTLNGIGLATPALGPQHLFGWGDTTFEWLGTRQDQTAPEECSPFLVNLDPSDVNADPPAPRPDGVVWPPMPLERGKTYPVQVIVGHSGQAGRYVLPSWPLEFNGYFDFEGDGEFDVPTERAIWWEGIPPDVSSIWSSSFAPPALASPPGIRLNFNLYVPHASVDAVWTRLRLDWGEDEGLVRRISPDLYPTIGTAQFGEVEDHLVTTTRGKPPLFQCYEIRRTLSPTRPAVTLVDQFGTITASAERPMRLCAPAVRGPAPLPPEPMHLEAYRLRHAWTPVENVEVTNEFGTIVVDVISPATLMVPTYKSLTAPPPISLSCGNGVVDLGEDCDPPGAKQCPAAAPVTACHTNCTCPPPNGIDHFECYKVRPAAGQGHFVRKNGVQVVDQFGAITVDLLKPQRLCAPVSKDGESPGAETHPDHLFCYKTRALPRFGARTVYLNNQFGITTMTLLRRQEICVPSTKRVL